jgi:hypothetical protein
MVFSTAHHKCGIQGRQRLLPPQKRWVEEKRSVVRLPSANGMSAWLYGQLLTNIATQKSKKVRHFYNTLSEQHNNNKINFYLIVKLGEVVVCDAAFLHRCPPTVVVGSPSVPAQYYVLKYVLHRNEILVPPVRSRLVLR